jgi:enediyne biosynthesis protein E3
MLALVPENCSQVKPRASKCLVCRLRRQLLGISNDAVGFRRRGFQGGSTEICRRLEAIGQSFLRGYHFALESISTGELESRLEAVEGELRGFAYEGAAMGLGLLERITPWRTHRIEHFLEGRARAHAYMVHVGIGWVWARAPFGFRRWQRRLDPLLGWLAFDGWGFHEGFFHWPKYVSGQPAPKKLLGYERRVFDQGLGRSFWFVNGGNVELIARTLSKFSASRQSDLWSGLGLGATYAGFVGEDSLQQLREISGPFQPQLAQGVAFAAKARQFAGNSTDYVNFAARVLSGATAEEAARVTDLALDGLAPGAGLPAYEIWRRRIQNHFVPNPQLQAIE